MVLLHVKKGDDELFLFQTPTATPILHLTEQLVKIHNGRLKIARICAEVSELADHGTALPPNMVGLASEQIEELRLEDSAIRTHIPSGGFVLNKDELSKRNGHAPNAEMARMLRENVRDAKAAIHKNLVKQGTLLTFAQIKEQFMKLKGAVAIVYPMGIPSHDSLHLELTCVEVENGDYREVFEVAKTALWWAGKELKRGQLLSDFLGTNEKTKAVVKMAVLGAGAPGREPIFTEEQKKILMVNAFNRQQEMEKLNEDEDDNYLNQQWADAKALKRCFQGIKDIKFAPS